MPDHHTDERHAPGVIHGNVRLTNLATRTHSSPSLMAQTSHDDARGAIADHCTGYNGPDGGKLISHIIDSAVPHNPGRFTMVI